MVTSLGTLGVEALLTSFSVFIIAGWKRKQAAIGVILPLPVTQVARCSGPRAANLSARDIVRVFLPMEPFRYPPDRVSSPHELVGPNDWEIMYLRRSARAEPQGSRTSTGVGHKEM